MLRITGIILACLFFMAPAEARQHHKHQHRHHVHHHHRIARVTKAPVANVFDIKGWWMQPAITYAPQRAVASQRSQAVAAHETIVAHPAGCPTRLFCGCGASVRVFGHSVRELWLAANWYKFPRTYPAPGAVAVRRHHVMVLEADLGGGVWQVYDANSGGHATRIHARSLAGYTIVQPRA